MRNFLIAGPILLYTLWVIVREIRRGSNPSCGGSAHHSIYGIPDDLQENPCGCCPARHRCAKQHHQNTQNSEFS